MKKKVIILIILLLIIVILGVVWFVSRDKTEEIINDQNIIEGNLQEKISENKEEIEEKHRMDMNLNLNLTKKEEFIKKAEEIDLYTKENLDTAYTQTDMNIESGIVAQKWDDLLNEVYNYLKETMDEEDFETLEKDEIRWIKEKEQAVDNAYKEYDGGALAPLNANSVAIRYTSDKCNYLINLIGKESGFDFDEKIKETLLGKSINVACVDSAYGENLISYSNSKDTKLYEGIYKEILKNYTSDSVLYIMQDDFDNNGDYEAFVYTSNKGDSSEEKGTMWFIASNNVKKLARPETEYDSEYYIDSMSLSNNKYIVYMWGEYAYKVKGKEAILLSKDELQKEIRTYLGDNIENYYIYIDEIKDNGDSKIIKGTAGIDVKPLIVVQLDRTYISANKEVEIKVSKEFEESDWLPQSTVYKFELENGEYRCIDQFVCSI